MAEQPEKCPKCGMAFYRTVQDAGSYLGGDDTLVSYSVDVDEFECSSRGTRDEGFFNQSGICLIRERDALRARVAELEAECDGALDIIRTRAPKCFVQCGEGRWAELAVAVLRLTEAWASLHNKWTPTASQVNALPEPVRRYIHDLETNCDPAGMVRDNLVLRENVAGMEARIAELEAALAHEREEAATLRTKNEFLFNQNCELNHRVMVEDADRIEKLEAALAASVPREVALRACEQAWKGGYGGSITSVDFAHDCLARAEAEAKEAKP